MSEVPLQPRDQGGLTAGLFSTWHAATPESWKKLPKVTSMRKTVVFKSQYRSHTRFGNDAPLAALWRGECAVQIKFGTGAPRSKKNTHPQAHHRALGMVLL